MKNRKRTQEFFDNWDEYHQLVSELDSYQFTQRALAGEIRGRMLDVGNGGVFNYDVTCAEHITVVDIAADLVAQKKHPDNVTFKWGDATALPVDANSFDLVLQQLILHHLAERNFTVTRQRTMQAIQEAYRVLKPGGRLVIIESCLPKPIEIAERLLFPEFRAFVRLIGHPIVFQWNWRSLAEFAQAAGFVNVNLIPVNLGRWVIQLGRKWPTALTPVRMYKLTAHKPPA